MTVGLTTRWVAECHVEGCDNIKPLHIHLTEFNKIGERGCIQRAKENGYTLVYELAACHEHASDLRYHQMMESLRYAQRDSLL